MQSLKSNVFILALLRVNCVLIILNLLQRSNNMYPSTAVLNKFGVSMFMHLFIFSFTIFTKSVEYFSLYIFLSLTNRIVTFLFYFLQFVIQLVIHISFTICNSRKRAEYSPESFSSLHFQEIQNKN